MTTTRYMVCDGQGMVMADGIQDLEHAKRVCRGDADRLGYAVVLDASEPCDEDCASDSECRHVVYSAVRS